MRTIVLILSVCLLALGQKKPVEPCSWGHDHISAVTNGTYPAMREQVGVSGEPGQICQPEMGIWPTRDSASGLIVSVAYCEAGKIKRLP